MLSTFLTLAVLAAAAQDAPMATSPGTARTELTAPPATPMESPVPAGAPNDDYALVAWCQGALRGHLELAEQIKDTLPLDSEQQAMGQQYLDTYEAALTAAPQSRTVEGPLRAAQAREAGLVRWNPARSAIDRATQTYTYLGWQLPGRCDQAAKRLSTDADLLGAALTSASQSTPAEAPAPATQP